MQHPFTAGHIATYIGHAQSGQTTWQGSVWIFANDAAWSLCQMLDCAVVWPAILASMQMQTTLACTVQNIEPAPQSSCHHHLSILQAAGTPNVTLFSHHNHVIAVANADLSC